MKYLIKDITDKTGKTRTDDRYPNRIGSTIQMNQRPVVGHPFIFRYVKHDEKGNCIEDHITMTSNVKKIGKCHLPEFVGVIVHTNNSIYYFENMEGKDYVMS